MPSAETRNADDFEAMVKERAARKAAAAPGAGDAPIVLALGADDDIDVALRLVPRSRRHDTPRGVVTLGRHALARARARARVLTGEPQISLTGPEAEQIDKALRELAAGNRITPADRQRVTRAQAAMLTARAAAKVNAKARPAAGSPQGSRRAPP